MKAKDNLDQLAVTVASSSLGILAGGLLFDETIHQLSIYSAIIVIICGLAIGMLHLLSRLF